MAKLSIEVKIEGLHIKVDGETADVKKITTQIGSQIAGMINPGQLLNGPSTIAPPSDPRLIEGEIPTKRGKGKKKAYATASAAPPAEALNWIHDPQKWGSPQQSWNTVDKCVWLLFVVKGEIQIGSLSAVGIVATFNKHFKSAKQTTGLLVKRELGKEKNKPKSLVGEDTTKNPPEWFLTQTGEARGQELVNLGKG
jgi:hypothetical protein